jgi:RND family efflux transporter MFP subunit
MTVCWKNRTFRRIRVVAVGTLFLVFLFLPTGCKKKAPPPPPPPTVTVAKPLLREVTDYLELTGNTQAVNTVQLVARVAGYLDKVLFRDGQYVKKDQLLFLIQQDTYVAGLQQAEGQVLALQAQLEYAQSQLERYTNLLPLKAAAQTDVDNWRYQRDSARANLETAVANRDLARLNLGYTKVAAPFAGRIDRRLQDPGSLVGAGGNTVLAQLTQIDPIYVYFTISDLDLARLTKSLHGLPGQSSAIKWPVFIGLVKEEGYPHSGRIDFAATSLTATTGTLLMRGVIPNMDGSILPGLYARVRVPLEKKAALLVPATAVASDQEGPYVLTIDKNNLVQRRGVKTGHLVGNMRVVEEGLDGKEWVIVRGLLKAHPRSPVTPERTSDKGPPSPLGETKVKP